MPPSIDTNHICLRKHSRPLFFNNSSTFLGLSAVCTMSDLSSSNFSNWIWWNTFDQNCFHPGWLSAPSSKSHYAPDSIFEEALIDKKIKRGKKAQTFSIYTHICHTCIILCAHCFWCALCKFDVWYGQCWIWAKSMLKYELLTNWNIDYLYVPCLLLIKACTHKNVKIKKSETAKPVQKHSWRFPPKSIVQVEILKRMNFRFLFFLLISCPIKSSKSKLAPLRLSLMLQKVKIGKIWRWVYFAKD